jgi:peptide/nickel transport system substrate-binding protein
MTRFGDKVAKSRCFRKQTVDGAEIGASVFGGHQTTADINNWTLTYAGLLNGPDPDAVSTYYISTAVPPTGSNRNGTNIPELDTLYPQGRLESDPTARAQIYQQICKILNENLPFAWMWVGQRFGAVSDNVQNFQWTPAPAGGRYYDAVETWTVSS